MVTKNQTEKISIKGKLSIIKLQVQLHVYFLVIVVCCLLIPKMKTFFACFCHGYKISGTKIHILT